MTMMLPSHHSAAMPLRISRASIAMLALLLCTACESRPRSAKPNVVLITIDTLRADHLQPYGNTKLRTPAISRLAAEGILFENAFTDTPWTLPSLASVMTGVYPSEHRVRTWNDPLASEHETLSEILDKHGYDTAAIVGSYPLDRYFGLAQGFHHYDDEMTTAFYKQADGARIEDVAAAPNDASIRAKREWRSKREHSSAYRHDSEVADAAIAWLSESSSQRFFLWIHFFGPHEKEQLLGLDAEARKALVRRQIAEYPRDVERTDLEVGRVLETLRQDPRFANTAVIYHSDHGQSLKEHGIFGHGLDLYDTTVQVPLVIRLPGGKRGGTRVSALVRNLDIFATILDLAGIQHGGRTSRSLLAARHRDDEHIYLETHHPLGLSTRPVDVGEAKRRVGRILRGIRTSELKLVRSEPMLAMDEDRSDPLPADFLKKSTSNTLFHSLRDPGEHENVAKSRGDVVAELETLLDAYDAGRGTTGMRELDASAIERLRAIGYDPQSLEPTDRPARDP